MMGTKPIPTRTDSFRHRLRRLKVNQSLKIARDEISPYERQAWYHAARVEGMKVSVKTAPDGVRLWRVK